MPTESPPKEPVPQAALTLCLRELPNCVILRNEEDLFGNLRRGGDVDLLVEDADLAERTLIRHLGAPVRIVRASDARGYSWDWGHVDLVQTIEWRGACYLPTKGILARRRLSERGRPVPTIAHEAVISWLTSLLGGGFFKDRYAPEIRKAVEIDGSAFRQTLIEVAGEKWGARLWQVAGDGRPEISTEWTRPLRQAVWWRAFWKSPPTTIQRFFAFVIAQLRLRLRPPVPWIAIIGADGSGKSTIATEIARRFTTCRYAAVREFIGRPRVMVDAQTTAFSHFVVATHWTVRYWTRLVHLRAKGFIPVVDDFDRIVGTTGYGYAASPARARAFRWLFPKPDIVFLLDAAPEVLWQRKQEVPLAELARQRETYIALVRQLPCGKVLDASLPPSLLVDEVQRAIRAWILDRSVGNERRSRMTAPIGRADGAVGAPIVVSRDDGKVRGTP